MRLIPRFSPAAVVEGARRGGTVFMAVPTMVHRLLGALDDDGAAALSSLRLVTCGSAALSADHLRAFEARTGHTILERYGMSETLITLSNPLDGERRPGAVGWPVPGTLISVFDDALQVSSRSAEDKARVHEAIVSFFEKDMIEARFVVPYDRQAMTSRLHEETRVLSEAYEEEGAILRVRAMPGVIAKLEIGKHA